MQNLIINDSKITYENNQGTNYELNQLKLITETKPDNTITVNNNNKLIAPSFSSPFTPIIMYNIGTSIFGEKIINPDPQKITVKYEDENTVLNYTPTKTHIQKKNI